MKKSDILKTMPRPHTVDFSKTTSRELFKDIEGLNNGDVVLSYVPFFYEDDEVDGQQIKISGQDSIFGQRFVKIFVNEEKTTQKVIFDRKAYPALVEVDVFKGLLLHELNDFHVLQESLEKLDKTDEIFSKWKNIKNNFLELKEYSEELEELNYSKNIIVEGFENLYEDYKKIIDDVSEKILIQMCEDYFNMDDSNVKDLSIFKGERKCYWSFESNSSAINAAKDVIEISKNTTVLNNVRAVKNEILLHIIDKN